MKTEEIIMIVFLGVLFTFVPLVIWLIHRDSKRIDREYKERIELMNKQMRK